MFPTLYWILIALAVLVGVMIVTYSVILWDMVYGSQGQRLDARLQAIGSGVAQQSPFQEVRRFSRIPWLDTHLDRFEWPKKIDRKLIGAGFGDTQVDRFLLLTFGIASLFFVLILGFGLSVWVALLFFLMGLVVPHLYLAQRVRARAAKFEEQLPDVLDFMARAMQAGHAFSPAIQMAATESPEPIATEFTRAQAEMNFGVPIGKVLSDLAERLDSADMRFFAVAVSINREVGGDLGDLLESVATLIRERVDMRASVMAMTAEGRFSALLLGALPFLIAGVLAFVNPGMLQTLWTDPMGRNMLFAALGLMVLGGLWMRQMIRIRI